MKSTLHDLASIQSGKTDRIKSMFFRISSIKHVVPVIIVIVLMSSFSSCKRRCIEGDGYYVVQSRHVSGDIYGVELDGSFNVYVTKDSVQSIEVDADSNLLPYISTRLRNQGILLIDSEKECMKPDRSINIYVSTPYLNSITLDGSGNIDVDSIDALEGIINLNGSGTIYLYAAVCDEFIINMDGSGVITVNDIVSDNCEVNHFGSGDIEIHNVYTINDIDAFLDGSGRIEIYNIDSRDVQAVHDGSGIIELEGYVDHASDLKLTGSGEIRAIRMLQYDCDAYISGSGSIFVHVDDFLTVDIPGSGVVYYRGNPIITLLGGTSWEQVIPVY